MPLLLLGDAQVDCPLLLLLALSSWAEDAVLETLLLPPPLLLLLLHPYSPCDQHVAAP